MTCPESEGLLHPQTYDPRKRPWYLRARTASDVVRVGPLVDAVTGRMTITIAALLMTAARNSLRANSRHHGVDLVRLFHKTNRDLVRDTGDDKFLTLFYGVVDDRDCSLTWVSGGHDPALWYHADNGTGGPWQPAHLVNPSVNPRRMRILSHRTFKKGKRRA